MSEGTEIVSSYFLAQLNITDKEEYRKYEHGFAEICAKHNGELFVVDENPLILEGHSSATRIVLICFSNEDDLRKWYYSQEYQALSEIRKNASDGNALILTGLDEMVRRIKR